MLLSNYYYQCLLIGVIIFALFGMNFKFLCCTKSIDILFDILNTLCLLVLIIDFVLNLVSGNEFLISFYFWVDLMGMILIVFDYSSIRDSIFENDDRVNKQFAYNFFIIIEVLWLYRIIILSKNFFKKKYKNEMSYYKDRLLMPETVIREIDMIWTGKSYYSK